MAAAEVDQAALAARQRALVAALGAPQGPANGLAALPGVEGGIERGMQAYRLNAQALSAKALASVFPQLQEALGGPDFEAMAWAFWRWAPPERGDLACWGGRLADFLGRQEGIDPALCDLARLEWAMHEAERAANAELDVDSLALLGGEDPGRLTLKLRPGLTLLPQATGPVLVWRKGWRACSAALLAGEAALLQALLEGKSLAAALDAAVVQDETLDFTACLQTALREAWLQAALPISAPSD